MRDFAAIVFREDFQVAGTALVEASAGTGKTYNIQNAYLRLVMTSGLPVQKILVVTFTEAATNELRTRLRAILAKCRDHLEKPLPDADPDKARIAEALKIPLPGMADDNTRKKEQLSRARLALMDFDSAAVFTIHGFCKRVLERFAFECGHDPDAELITAQDQAVEEVCRDWWRGNTYLQANFAAKVPFKQVDELKRLVTEVLKRPDADLRPAHAACADWEETCRSTARSLKTYGARKAPAAENKDLDALAGKLGRLDRDIPWILETFKDALAELSRPLTPEVEALRTACAAVWHGIESLKGNIAWGRNATLSRAKNAPVSAGPIVQVVKKHGAAILNWRQDRGEDTGGRHGAGAGKDALRPAIAALIAEAAAVPQTGDAKPFCRNVQTIANSGPDLVRLRRRIYADMMGIAGELAARIRAQIRDRSALTYEGMLGQVREALDQDDAGPRLLRVLRQEFSAALIDEFQDTDPVQYAIFKKVFGDSGLPLVFVGDPKQAIYGFRGGDVFTYYGAKKDVAPEHRHSLAMNYRAEKSLVAAVNELFIDSGDDPTFLNLHIRYSTPLAAHDVQADQQLLAGGQRDAKPLRIWKYPAPGGRTPGKNSATALQMYADVAGEVVRLLADKKLAITGCPVSPKDVAVLVLDHEEADYIQQALLRRGVNAVRQATGNVFDAEEAAGMVFVMQAMLDPGRARAVRSALCVPMIPCSEAALKRFNEPQEMMSREPDAAESSSSAAPEEKLPWTLEGWMDVFREAGLRWRNRSFIEGFRYLLDRLALRAHIVGLPDGERRLANLLQLVELTHQAERDQQLGPVALLRWFGRQCEADTRVENEDFKIRLVSDDQAVRIMTIFKSKGLEFPIVFLPTLWRREANAVGHNRLLLKYHDPENGQMVLDRDTADEQAKNLAQVESLEENLRLAYVGLTRAVNRTYVWALDGDPAKDSVCALVRLLNRRRARLAAHAGAETHVLEQAAPPPEAADAAPWAGQPHLRDPETLRVAGKPEVDKSHGHASFSSLAPYERKLAALDLRDLDKAADPEEPAEHAPQAINIFSIPGGAKTGDCFHRIFEALDFKAPPAEAAKVVDAELDRSRICTGPTADIVGQKRQAVQAMVKKVLNASLGEGEGMFKLKDVALAARRSELAFHFSLKQQGPCQTTAVVRDILKGCWKSKARHAGFLEELDQWDRDLPLGFMTGFIDLVLQHNQKFYLLDWKSNKRRGQAEDFDAPGLAEEMAKHAYYLQYMIYAVAVHGFLGQVLQGYNYEKHFGGVFYIFLRGVDGTPGRGVFHDKPPAKLIIELARVLAAGTGGVA